MKKTSPTSREIFAEMARQTALNDTFTCASVATVFGYKKKDLVSFGCKFLPLMRKGLIVKATDTAARGVWRVVQAQWA